MARILYISCHSILEHDELTLLTELGHDCFSLGAYTDPAGHYLLPRPGIKDMKTKPLLMDMVKNMPRTELTWQFIDNFDIIIIMDGYSGADIISGNWHLFKGKKVIWRTIGQSIPETESRMRKFRKEGMHIVRYSPYEERIDNYIGMDTVIRFYKDPFEFCNWTGHVDQVINASQSLKARRDFCGYDTLIALGAGNPFKVYGSGNEDLGDFNGGELDYGALKGAMRDCKAYLYGGTWPASYTLSFIEAMMTGIPMVCAGADLWKLKSRPTIELYEIPEIIQNGTNGFCSSNLEELRTHITRLRTDSTYAKSISIKGRETAIKLFDKKVVKEQWKSFLMTL